MLRPIAYMFNVDFQFYLFKFSEFSNEKNRVDRRVQYYKTRSRKLFIQNMSSYLEWITQAG